MLVSDILERLDQGEKLKTIGEGLGVSASSLQRRLRALGYEWDNSAKRWKYIGSGEEPLQTAILDVSTTNRVKSPSPKRNLKGGHEVKDDSPKIHPSPPNNVNQDSPTIHNQPPDNSHEIHPAFTHDEVNALKRMIRQWQLGLLDPAPDDLFERVRQLDKSDKLRRTVIIPKHVADAVDEFVKVKGVDKSDIYSLALLDFMTRYK